MTDFKSYPDVHVDLPEDGKVTGTVKFWFRGDGSIGARTDYNRLTFRDQEFSIHLEFTRQDDGTIVESGKYDSVRRDFSDAPPSYRDKIIAVVLDLARTVWTPEREREGLEADVAQNLTRLESKERELTQQLDEVREQIATHHKRL